jgi:tripartite-type tricarboxylate transporter receptor subunit TctC
MQRQPGLKGVFATAAIMGALAAPAMAQQDVAAFYKGKQIKMYIGFSPGGGYDLYARLVARHLGDHIPGRPAVVPLNMGGAGGGVLTSYLLNVAERDGTAIGAIAPGAITAPLMLERNLYDPRPLIYVGSANSEELSCVVRSDAPVKTYQEVFSKELVIGGTAPQDTTYDFPALQNSVLGTRFRIVTGYTGTSEINLAINKNEVQGLCGFARSSMLSMVPDWLPSGFAKMLVQESMEGRDELNKQGIPRTADFAKSAQDRAVLNFVYEQQKFGRPYALPPSVPADRVAALRTAFKETLQDKTLLAEAARSKVPIKLLSGEETQALVDAVFKTPPEIIDRAKKALGYSKK